MCRSHSTSTPFPIEAFHLPISLCVARFDCRYTLHSPPGFRLLICCEQKVWEKPTKNGYTIANMRNNACDIKYREPQTMFTDLCCATEFVSNKTGTVPSELMLDAKWQKTTAMEFTILLASFFEELQFFVSVHCYERWSMCKQFARISVKAAVKQEDKFSWNDSIRQKTI